jgi:DNA-binding CsgD family transcriptional regulator
MAWPSVGGLLERDAILVELNALVDGACGGAGNVLVVEGAPGIGKTALLWEAGARADRVGVAVLSASGAELEQELAYGVVRQLFAPLTSDEDPSAELWEGAAELARPVLDPTGSSSATHADQFAVLHGLFSLCASMAGRSPVAVIVDDAHWADATSLRWLAYLARRVAELPVLVVIARRPSPAAGAADILTGLSADPATLTRTLLPLTEAGSATVVRRAVGAEVPEEICRSCHLATGGNPFYLGELVTAGGEALTSAGEAVEVMAPERVMRSVLVRLAALGLDAASLARAVAILGPRVPLRHAASLAGLDAQRADTVADDLAAASILLPERPLEFFHPIVRSAVYGELGEGARSALHHRAARILHVDGSDPPDVAVKLLAAEPYGDPWVVARLGEAAQSARSRGDPGAAAVYLTRALAEPPGPDDLGDVLFELGAAERQVMAPGAEEHLTAALSIAEQPRRRAEIALDLMPMLIHPDRLPEALEVLRQVLPEAIEHAPDIAAQLEANRAALPSFHLTSVPPDTASSYRLLERLDPLDLPSRLLRGVLAMEAMVRGRPAAEIWELLDSALTDSRTRIAQSGADTVLLIATITATLCERFDPLESVYDELLEEYRRRGAAFGMASVHGCRSQLYFRLGRVGSAEDEARQAIDALAGLSFVSPTGQLVDALLERGEIAEALEVLERTGCDGDVAPNLFSILFLPRRIRLRVAARQLDHALADLELAERWAADASIERAAAIPWRVEGALACLAAGQPERAMSLADEQLDLARAFGAPGALGIAQRTAGVVHGGDGGLELLADSAGTLAQTPLRLEHAKSLAALGAAQRRGGHRSEARATLAEALDLADACGSSAVAAQAREELVVAGARPRRNRSHGPKALTERELRTATLAAQGMTNAEIARDLFVTAKTVERHLTNCYAKLGIASRRDLPELLTRA